MARRRQHGEHENHERWLVSYADFITLLFAFFVVMYSISSVNEGKYRVLSDALMAAFREPTRTLEPIQVGRVAKTPYDVPPELQSKPMVIDLPLLPVPAANPAVAPDGVDHGKSALQAIAEEMEEAMAPLIDEGLIAVRAYENFLEVEIKASILFDSGSAQLAPAAVSTLQRMVGILTPFPNPIRVEGYTDNVPIATERFPSNWELSAGRAASVVHLFVSQGLDPMRLSAVGYGEFRPVANNGSEEGRAKNRRVVLVVQAGEDARGLLAATEAAVRKEGGLSLDGIFPSEVTQSEPVPPSTTLGAALDTTPARNSSAGPTPVVDASDSTATARGQGAVPELGDPEPSRTPLAPPINPDILPPIDLAPALPFEALSREALQP